LHDTPNDPFGVGAVQVDREPADRTGAQGMRARFANENTAGVEDDKFPQTVQQDLQGGLELHRNGDSGQRLEQQAEL